MPRTAISKYPLLAVIGITALSVAACGSSTSGSPTSSSKASGTTSTSTSASSSTPTSTSGTPSAQGNDHVAGLIASVAGTTIQVTQQSGAAAVAYSPSTAISQVTPAQLTDVTPGSCVAVRLAGGGGQQSGGTVTARRVFINTSANGQCQPPRGRGGVGGAVSSVNGNTIVVNATGSNGNTQTNVQVDNTTTYAKRAVANSQAITQGECIAARGTKDSGGTLQATTISLRPADNGTCGQPNGGWHHHGG